MVIGLTGKYCSGKNTAAAIFEGMGYPSIDVDKLGHLALEVNIESIRSVFGDGVIADAGAGPSVDRKALGEIVFSEPAELQKLESVLHPWMKDETARIVEEYTAKGTVHIIINAAVLYKIGLDELCDCIVWIEAPLPLRIFRALSRDSAGIISVIKRIHAQRQLKPKPSENSVDIYRVGNGAGQNRLSKKIAIVLDNIEQKGRNGR